MISPALILFRHGNTFENGQKPVWIGARTNLVLTKEGKEQAKTAAEFLAEKVKGISAIIAAPLLRTRHFAEIINEKIGCPLSTDERLCEIDYGLWEGLSSEEIKETFGEEKFFAWDLRGEWPENMGWASSLEEMKKGLSDFLAEEKNILEKEKTIHVAVTSNGVLRLIYSLVSGNPADSNAKVKTGNYCIIAPTNDSWKIEKWNEKP